MNVLPEILDRFAVKWAPGLAPATGHWAINLVSFEFISCTANFAFISCAPAPFAINSVSILFSIMLFCITIPGSRLLVEKTPSNIIESSVSRVLCAGITLNYIVNDPDISKYPDSTAPHWMCGDVMELYDISLFSMILQELALLSIIIPPPLTPWFLEDYYRQVNSQWWYCDWG